MHYHFTLSLSLSQVYLSDTGITSSDMYNTKENHKNKKKYFFFCNEKLFFLSSSLLHEVLHVVRPLAFHLLLLSSYLDVDLPVCLSLGSHLLLLQVLLLRVTLLQETILRVVLLCVPLE